MDRDPGHLAVDKLALSCVQSDAQVEPEVADGIQDRARAANSTRRSIEAREEVEA